MKYNNIHSYLKFLELKKKFLFKKNYVKKIIIIKKYYYYNFIIQYLNIFIYLLRILNKYLIIIKLNWIILLKIK